MKGSASRFSFLSRTPIPSSTGYSHAFPDVKTLTREIHRAAGEYFERQQQQLAAEKQGLATGDAWWRRVLYGESAGSGSSNAGAAGSGSALISGGVGVGSSTSGEAMVSVYEGIDIGRELSVRAVYKECRERARGRHVPDHPPLGMAAARSGASSGSAATTAGSSDPFMEIVSRRKVAATLSGDKLQLAGAIIAVSDSINVSGYLTRYGVASDRFHKLPTKDDPLIEWLRKNGANCVGKLRCGSPFSYDDSLAADDESNPIAIALLTRSCHFCVTKSLIGCPGLTAVQSGVVTFKPTTGSFVHVAMSAGAASSDTAPTTAAAAPGGGEADGVVPISHVATTSITANSVEDIRHLWELFSWSQDSDGLGSTADDTAEEEEVVEVGGAPHTSGDAASPLHDAWLSHSAGPGALVVDQSRFERDRDISAVLAASSNFSTEGAEVLVGVPLAFIDSVATFSRESIGYYSGNEHDDGHVPDSAGCGGAQALPGAGSAHAGGPPAAAGSGHALPRKGSSSSVPRAAGVAEGDGRQRRGPPTYGEQFMAHMKRLAQLEHRRFASSRRGLTWSSARPPTRIEFVDVPLAIPHDSDILRQYELLAQYDLARLFMKLTNTRDSERALNTGLLEELPSPIVTRIYNGLRIRDREYSETKASIAELQRAIAAAFADVDVLCTPLLCPQYAGTSNLRLLSLTLPFTLAGYPTVACPLALPVHTSIRSMSPLLHVRRKRARLAEFANLASGVQFIGELGRDSALIEDSSCITHSIGFQVNNTVNFQSKRSMMRNLLSGVQ